MWNGCLAVCVLAEIQNRGDIWCLSSVARLAVLVWGLLTTWLNVTVLHSQEECYHAALDLLQSEFELDGGAQRGKRDKLFLSAQRSPLSVLSTNVIPTL